MKRLALALVLLSTAAHARPVEVQLWHSYRGAEEQALTESLNRLRTSNPDLRVDALAVPYEVLASKLSTAIPNDNGPDVFVFAHERVSGWAAEGLLLPVPEEEASTFLPQTLPPLRVDGQLQARPLAFKSVALFFNRALVPEAPRTTDELVSIASSLSGGGRFGLAYEAGNFFHHAAWHLGFGGSLLDENARIDFRDPGSIAALSFVKRLDDAGILPAEPSGALVSQLFNDRQAALTINGPWFIGELDPDIDFGIAPLPIVSETGRAASPLLTVEAVYVSSRSKVTPQAEQVARFLAGHESATIRALIGRQVVANVEAWTDERIASDPVLSAFKAQLATATPTDNRPEMRNVWEPAALALKKTLRGEATPEEAAQAAQRRYEALARPEPPPAEPTPYLVLGIALLLAGVALVLRWVSGVRKTPEARMASVGATWVAPAMVAVTILIFVPFGVGLVLSLFSHHQGTFTFVGLANYKDIVLSRGFAPSEPMSFYYALVVTVAWTAVNLALHVGIGLGLALLLNRSDVKLKGLWRVLLIIPWAVPNYITALLWKGLFHKQFGAINGMLEALGLGGISWFSSFGTAFFANVCTNAWLGFPFMMVVCMGALQSIPKDLYEAADVDGASGWDKLKHITLPLLQPALVPAVLLGMVWTFNQFNVVYLVSGGEPDNSTDILISEAYRWAFARREQYGYAAAYAALIFVILLGWSFVSRRLARAAEEVG